MAEVQQQYDGLTLMSGDLTLKSGNISTTVGTITSGGALTVSSGGATVTAGGLTVTAGTTALNGAVLQAGITTTQGGTGAAVTFTTANVINRKLPTGACTGAILAAGTVNGQIIIVTNEAQNTSYSITFDVPATSNVWDDGTNPQVIKAGTAKMFVWISAINTTGAWVALAPYAG